MKHHHHPITWALLALLIGLSISGGPVVWAVLVMISPLVIGMLLTARSVAHVPHPAEPKPRVERRVS